MNKLKEIEEKIILKEVELFQLENEKRDIIKRKIIKCPRCGKQHIIGKTELIQEHYYIRPYSCTAGDYWVDAEIGFTCDKCNNFISDYHNPKIKEWKYLFNEIKDVYENDSRRGSNDFIYSQNTKEIKLYKHSKTY